MQDKLESDPCLPSSAAVKEMLDDDAELLRVLVTRAGDGSSEWYWERGVEHVVVGVRRAIGVE